MATTTIPNLPSGSNISSNDLLIFEDTANNITKKSTSGDIWWNSNTIQLTPINGLTVTSNSTPITLSLTLYRITPHFSCAFLNFPSTTIITNTLSTKQQARFTGNFPVSRGMLFQAYGFNTYYPSSESNIVYCTATVTQDGLYINASKSSGTNPSCWGYELAQNQSLSITGWMYGFLCHTSPYNP